MKPRAKRLQQDQARRRDQERRRLAELLMADSKLGANVWGQGDHDD